MQVAVAWKLPPAGEARRALGVAVVAAGVPQAGVAVGVAVAHSPLVVVVVVAAAVVVRKPQAAEVGKVLVLAAVPFLVVVLEVQRLLVAPAPRGWQPSLPPHAWARERVVNQA